MAIKKFRVNLRCKCPCCQGDIKSYFNKIKGVDEIVGFDWAQNSVSLRGNFKEVDVIKCFWEEIGKKSQVVVVVVEVESPEQPRRVRGRVYGEIEECW
ncbi:hypothetical protein M9H77_01167 [Catharanthus roseus]|uniref:Uncharacterized protein n=1 Tax=Catharanthus roseus TaxID=4058 RepID=A0ACC0C4R7_CATRO|nr:hypothetical protein M9H77_01167 [Catharanthus roseus]